jgi:uncharacterized small protein (DUF1192 family)
VEGESESHMIDSLRRQIELLEAEIRRLQAKLLEVWGEC